MRCLPIPKNWEIRHLGTTWKLDNQARTLRLLKRIEYKTPHWLWLLGPFRRAAITAMLNHELAHAWGVLKDGGIQNKITGQTFRCKKLSCLSYESAMHGKPEAWWEPIVHGVCSMFNRFQFCKHHKLYLFKQMLKENVMWK